MILANRHHIWLFAAAYTAGILLAGQMPQHQILPAILILAGIGAVCYLHPAKKECVILALLLSGAVLSGFGLTRHQAMQYTKRVSLAEQHMETSVRISGILTQKEQKSDKYLYQIKQTYLETDQTPMFLGNILLYTTKDNCSIGTILTAEGELDVFLPARNEGNFDFAAYYQQMNITCRFYADTVTVQKPSRFSIREVLYQLQQKIMQTYTTELNERDAGILSTLVAGSNAQLDAQTKESYRKAGISHILAVSGVKTLKLDIPLVPELRINWAFVPLHIAIIYILKLCLDEEIIPRCRFPCSRGYFKKCINWQKKQSFSVSQSYCKSLINQQKEKKPMAYKKYREMKVYEASGYQYKRTPSIVLKGQWLSELGFDIGEQIEVKCEDGRLIITKANEIWSAEA